MTGRRLGAGVIVALLAVLHLAPVQVRAQERDGARPLTKSELVRLLVNSSLSQAEIAQAVRRACLTFEPDEEDLSDLEQAGAGSAVLEQVNACSRAAAPIRLSWSSEAPAARAGEPVVLEARAVRGGSGVEGLELVLQEGGERVASARTDTSGTARFRLAGGTSPGRRIFRVRSAEVPPDGEPSLTVNVAPGPPARATLSTSSLSSGSDPARVSVRVRDAFGNPVGDVPVRLVADSTPGGGSPLRLEGRTGSAGATDFRLAEDRLPRGARLVLLHRSDTLAVSRPVPTLAQAEPGAAESEAAPDAGGRDTAGAATPREAGSRDTAATPDRGPDRPEEASPAAGEETPAEGDPARAAAERDRSEAAAEGDRAGAAAAVTTGRTRLRAGRPLDAVTWFRRAVERRPSDGEAWSGLGRAWLAAGEPALARRAFRDGRRRAEDSMTVRTAVDQLGGLPPWGGVRLLGGGGWRAGGVQDVGSLVFRGRPSPGLSFWAGYESTLVTRFPALVRGGGDVSSVGGGAAYAYGPRKFATTGLTIARLDHGAGARQYVYRLENELRFSAGGQPLRWRIRGMLGRWWDRDDWLVSTDLEVPVSDEVSLLPSLHVGETSGTAVTEVGRRPARERRGGLAVALEPRPGWSVVPAVALASVDPLSAADAGTLVEGRLRLSVPVSPSVRFLLRGRHQRPPFADAFTDLAVGLAFALR